MTSTKKDNFVARIVDAIAGVVRSESAALHEPSFSGNEWSYIKACLDSKFVSSVGEFVGKFEAQLEAYTGSKHAIAMTNGTAALHVALKLAGVIEGDEVLVPALTFIATANAIAYCGARPHFVDSEENTLGIDPRKLRDYLESNTKQLCGQCINTSTGRPIRALVPMHTFGHPVDLNGLMEVADQFNLPLIEDSAESIGSTYRGKHTGTFGLMGVFSFNGNKTITTGGGGALLTQESGLARRAKHLSTTAKLPHPWNYQHDEIGFNYRMPNLNAALGCAQLEQLPRILNQKRALFHRYQCAFGKIKGVRLVTEPDDCKSNYWLQTLMLYPDYAHYFEEILIKTNEAGYMTRPAWGLVSEMSPYRDCQAMNLACAKSLSQRLINVPSSV